MKKYLIALPLVLIMILSMVPVMAANVKLSVPVTYYKTPEQKDVLHTETRIVEVDEAILKDAKKLEAAVKAKVESFGFPKLDTDVQPEWTVRVEASAQTAEQTTYSAVSGKYSDLTFAALKGMNPDVIFEVEQNVTVNDDQVVQTALAQNYNGVIDKIVAGNGTATEAERTVTIKANDLKDKVENTPVVVDIKSVSKKTTPGQDAEAKAFAYPKCFVDPSKPVEKWCPELCEYIVVRVFNAYNNLEIESAMRQYKVDPHKLPTFDKLYEHYMNNYFPRGYQVLKDWKNQNDIWLPTAIDRDCTIFIWVLPLNQKVNVYHVLRDCCINLDGDIEYNVWKVFEELNQTVPFIEYHTDLVINQDKAKEYATTRLQKINAMDFVFDFATFDDGVRLDNYLTGPVYDLDGRLVEVIVDETPTITIVYNRVGCQKEEEKVDNATVENTNTQAPVTASGTQLPATGAKDVTAFFLSAVALLGLGIFFAKKH